MVQFAQINCHDLSEVEKIDLLEKGRLARECAKLNLEFEQNLAEEGFDMELDEWPEY